MPRLCVLIAARNAESTIRSAISSTVTALPRDAQIVVLVNGSHDRTAEVAASVRDRRVRVLDEPATIGYVRARTRLLERSDSELVAVMDADDVCLPWRFVHQVRHLRTADAVVSPVVRFSTGPLRLHPGLPLPITADAMPLHLALSCPLAHPTLIARRAVLDGLGGYRQTPAEDYDLYLRIVTAGLRLIRTAVPCVAYREHALQTSRADDFGAAVRSDPTFRGQFADFLAACLDAPAAEVDAVASGQWPSPARIDDLVGSAVGSRHLGALQERVLARSRRAPSSSM